MKKILFLIAIITCWLSCSTLAQRGGMKPESIIVNGISRTYYVFAPTNLPKDNGVPLVMIFHGGGGEGSSMSQLTKFNWLAQKEHFIAVYPNGIGKNWNDGREDAGSEAFKQNVDDGAFVTSLLDELTKNYKIDTKRIFATGMSNGGIFSNYLGAKMSNRFAAIAPVVGGIADPFYKEFAPKEPVSVLIIQGTADPLMPYNGGNVARNRGKIIATNDTVKLWTKNNGTNPKPTLESFDADKNDPCTVDKFTWSGGRNRSEVVLYKLNGGGHTWAGGSQYMPRLIVGDVCRDINATDVIWEFFKNHPKQ